MSVFPDWKDHAVHQRRPMTGCIPTAYEMILRAAQAEGIDFQTFQDDFDLDINLGRGQTEPKNHFGSIAAEIKKKYPWVIFNWKSFVTGAEKISFIDKQLEERQPVLISLTHQHGWHIMPVVDATEDQYLLLENVDADGTLKTRWIGKAELSQVHNSMEGGKEVAFLAELSKSVEESDS